eukprot:944573_1
MFSVPPSEGLQIGQGFSVLEQAPRRRSPWRRVAGRPEDDLTVTKRVESRGEFINDTGALRSFLGINGIRTIDAFAKKKRTENAAKLAESSFLLDSQTSGVVFYLKVEAEQFCRLFNAADFEWKASSKLSATEFLKKFGDSYIAEVVYGARAVFQIKFAPTRNFTRACIKAVLTDCLRAYGVACGGEAVVPDEHRELLMSLPYQIRMVSCGNLVSVSEACRTCSVEEGSAVKHRLAPPSTIAQMAAIAKHLPAMAEARPVPIRARARIHSRPPAPLDARALRATLTHLEARAGRAAGYLAECGARLGRAREVAANFEVSEVIEKDIRLAEAEVHQLARLLSDWLARCRTDPGAWGARELPRMESVRALLKRFPNANNFLTQCKLAEQQSEEAAQVIVAEGDKPVIIKVVSGSISKKYKLGSSARFGKLMAAHIELLAVPAGRVKFVWKGRRVLPEHTVEQLGIQSGDEVIAHVVDSELPSEAGDFVVSMLLPNSEKIPLRVLPSTACSDLWTVASTRIGAPPTGLTSVRSGRPVGTQGTVGELGIQDGDEIMITM